MEDTRLLAILHETATEVRSALDALDHWGLAPAGRHDHQYDSDLVADAAAIKVLDGAGLGILSEESGRHHGDRAIVVVIDPVDGSTNASRGLPWYATSLCALDAAGLLAAVVVNQASGIRYEAVRGAGARRDGVVLHPSTCRTLDAAMVGVNGFPPVHLGWSQYRAFGAAALDLCAVAAGQLDAYVDCTRRGHGPWDYLGGMLVCLEAGAFVADGLGDELQVLGHADRRTPVAAATPELLAEALAARRSFP